MIVLLWEGYKADGVYARWYHIYIYRHVYMCIYIHYLEDLECSKKANTTHPSKGHGET